MKSRDHDTKQAFQIELQNRFESLFLQEEEEERVRNLNGDEDERAQDTDINAQWEITKKILVDTCGSVVGRMKRTRNEWLSDETYRKVEERRNTKQILNGARTRQGKLVAIRYYNEKNREVKKSCRRDKRNSIESTAREAEDAAKKNDLTSTSTSTLLNTLNLHFTSILTRKIA